MNRILVVLFLVFSTIAFVSSGDSLAHGLDDGKSLSAHSMVDVDDCDQGDFGLGDLFEDTDDAQPPMSSAKTIWSSATQCQTACRNQGCSSYQYVSNGHGDGTCTCSGCPW